MKRELADHSFRMKSLAAAVGLLSGGVQAADFEVTNRNDSGEGSLRWAIDQAESTPGQDNITFASSVSGTINLQSALPTITEGLSITAPGITLNASAIESSEGPAVISIYGSTSDSFSLSGMTIRGSQSGAIYAGTEGEGFDVTLSDMVLTRNTVRPPIIARDVNLTINDSVISGNSSSNTGGIYARNVDLAIYDSEISDNVMDNNEGQAGGIALRYSEAAIVRSSITGNTSAADAGGISLRRTSLDLTYSSVDDNTADFSGGGIKSGAPASLNIRNSSISGNQAGAFDGGEYAEGGLGPRAFGGRPGYGGAISMYGWWAGSASLTLASSVISGNSATIAGGISLDGNLYAYGSTISDNSAQYAGALDVSAYRGVIFGSTISGNSAAVDSVGAIEVERYGEGGFFTIDSTTISGNTLTGESEDDDAGALFIYIEEDSHMMIENSTISNNEADGPVVEVYSEERYASFTMRNSTMSGNTASSAQSAMVIENITYVDLLNNTFVDNNATLPSSVSGETAQVSLHNSQYQRFEGPYYGPYIYGQMNVNVSGNAMTSSNDKEMLVGGPRLSSDPYAYSEGDPVAAVLTSNIMENGVTIAANSTNTGGEAPDMVDPMLGALSMQGGFTAVHMPLPGSPAINGGDTNMRPDERDQRGLQTVINNFDIGSVEVTSNTAPTLTVNLPKQIGGVVGKEIPGVPLAELYEDAEGDMVAIEEVYGLPAGLTWDGTNVSGTLEAAGTYLVTVVASDNNENPLQSVTQVEVVVKEKASAVPFVEDDDDDDFLGSVPLGGLALLGFLAALRRRRQ